MENTLANKDRAKQEWLNAMDREMTAAMRAEEQERLIERTALALVNGEATDLK